MNTSDLKISIARDFSDSPGARYRSDGPKSGEEFLEELLEPRFQEAINSGQVLMVDLDDVWGYASSFISGSFGMLSHKYGTEKVKKHIKFKSNDDALLVNKIMREIDDPGYK